MTVLIFSEKVLRVVGRPDLFMLERVYCSSLNPLFPLAERHCCIALNTPLGLSVTPS
jgi:hypothetical protein